MGPLHSDQDIFIAQRHFRNQATISKGNLLLFVDKAYHVPQTLVEMEILTPWKQRALPAPM